MLLLSALLLAGGQPARAEIVYSGPNQNVTYSRYSAPDTFSLFGHPGTWDNIRLFVLIYEDPSDRNLYSFGNMINVHGNYIYFALGHEPIVIKRFAHGDIIDGTCTFRDNHYGYFSIFHENNDLLLGEFRNQTGFAGFRMIDGTNTYYGWIQIRVEDYDNNQITGTLIDWAYQSDPGQPIRAGQRAGSLVVTTLLDEDDGTSDPSFGTGTSLREALAYAATLTGPQTITFSDTDAGGAVNFHDGTPRTMVLGGTPLAIDSEVTLAGPGADALAISGNRASRVIDVGSGRTVEISGLTIRNGHPETDDGGGIYNAGTLTLRDCTLRENFSTLGGGICNSGTLTVRSSTLGWNDAIEGGAIYNTGTLTLLDSALHDNVAGFGGGIHNAGTLTVRNSTLSRNHAFLGGGIENSGTLTVLHSTLSGNNAGERAGGIHNALTATLNIGHTILHGGVATGPNYGGGAPQSLGYNISSDDTGPDSATDLLATDPLLGPLEDHGGPTLTHALLFGSPALNAGDPGFDPEAYTPPLTTDQRGEPRIVNGRVDIGAYERENFSVITHVTPNQANAGGGIDIVIQGAELGNGADITHVTLAGVAATILTQSVSEVTVRANPAPGAVTGDVAAVSTSLGTVVSSNAFEYLWLAPPEQLDPVDITSTALAARWRPVPEADTHYLEVGLDPDFTAHLPAYEWVDVYKVQEYPVSGLTDGAWYAIRLFAANAHGLSRPSNIIWVPAGKNTPYELNSPPSAPVTEGADMVRRLAYMFHGTGLVYTAVSSAPDVVSVAINNGMLGIDPSGPGQAIITLTATDPGTGYTATYRFTIEVTGPPTLLSEAFLPREAWNPRFTQVLEVHNDSGSDAIGVRVLFDDLMPGIEVETRTGIHSDGRPMIEWETPFAAGTTQQVRIVYLATGAHRPDQHPPALEVQYILPEWEPPATGAGIAVDIRAVLPDGRVVLEFNSVPGLLYAIEYMDGFPDGAWREAPVRLRAGANRTQWIDPGPPTTPEPEGLRVYRVRWMDEGNAP